MREPCYVCVCLFVCLCSLSSFEPVKLFSWNFIWLLCYWISLEPRTFYQSLLVFIQG